MDTTFYYKLQSPKSNLHRLTPLKTKANKIQYQKIKAVQTSTMGAWAEKL